jgi:hypothetical protein
MQDNKMFVLFFNGSDGIIHLEAPPNRDATAEIIAERYRFLRSIAGVLSRFSEDVVAVGQAIGTVPKEL